jgi:hypothetical protein
LIWAAATTALVAVLWLAVSAWYRSPEQIRNRSLAALERNDASSLCNLADEQELHKLSLSPDNVSAYLNEIGWKPGNALDPFERVRQPVDLATWKVANKSAAPGAKPIIISLIDTPPQGWKLNLSILLWSMAHHMDSSGHGGAVFRRLARKSGITGIRVYEGQYKTHEEVEAEIQSRASH